MVTKIPTDPVQAGKTFNGWYIMVSGKKEPVVWTSFIKAQLIHQHGGVIYADWTVQPLPVSARTPLVSITSMKRVLRS